MADSRSRRGHMVVDLAETLRSQIKGGDYAPGDRLPSEAHLSETYGVSRTVIREAIAALRADGLVRPRQGSGVYVLKTEPTEDPPFLNVNYDRVSSVVEILELRAALESEAAALAAVRRSPAQEEKIIECMRKFLSCERDGTPTSEADFALHIAIAESSNNRRFSELLRLLGVNSIPRRALRPEGAERQVDEDYLSLIGDEHQQIVDAILDGNAEDARQAMRVHLEGSLMRYRKLLNRNLRQTGT